MKQTSQNEYKLYQEVVASSWCGCKRKYLRVCHKHKTRFYTIEWWMEHADGDFKKRRSMAYPGGIKFVRDITKDEFELETFISAI